MRIIITGGHHSSALPVIAKLKEKNPEVQIFWIGHKFSMKGDKNPTLEFREITSLGIPFFDLKAGKVYKTFDLGRLMKVPLGVIQSFYYINKTKPDVILSFGGYLAAPVVLAGWFLGVPSVTHEQTVVAGYANRFISHFVRKILISWKESAKYFPAKKVIYVGIPLRNEIFQIKSNSFVADNGFPTVYISAGKTGSHIINEIVKRSLESLLRFCNVIHQSGDHSFFNDYELIENEYKKVKPKVKGKLFLRKFVFEDEIGEALNRSNIVVARSGAHTIAEILALNKPCILIPIPWVSHNEQNENARMLKSYGLAEILDQNNLTPDALVNQVKNSLNNLSKYNLKDKSSLGFLEIKPAELIANEVINISKEKK